MTSSFSLLFPEVGVHSAVLMSHIYAVLFKSHKLYFNLRNIFLYQSNVLPQCSEGNDVV